MTMLIFVYGTLKRFGWNHHVIERTGGQFIGKAKMEGKDMYYAGGMGSFPAVVDGKGEVYGEVFRVPKDMVHHFDNLEGYNSHTKTGMYLRKRAKVTLENGRKVWVSYYYWNREIRPELKIKSGHYPVEEK